MLHSLDIKNYRNLESLEIHSLGRVNLITGKNNTGKSTLLEAVAIHTMGGDFPLIEQLLEDRGEPFKYGEAQSVETKIKVLSSLFHNRNIGFDEVNAILIGGGQDSKDSTSLRLVKYVEDIITEQDGSITRKKRLLQHGTDATLEDLQIGFEAKTGSQQRYILPLAAKTGIYFFRFQNNIQIINTKSTGKDTNDSLFDNIALTDKEQSVIEALKIIEPLTERIAFVEDATKKRNAVIKLSNSSTTLPLQSMGDGINRILTIILAMVNADKGYLLIDEFENGLHYSVQEKLWEIIFKLSEDLNIQVFATTHSNDCIQGFESVLNKQSDLSAGKLIRLDNKNGVIKQVEFDAQELKIAANQNIELR